MGHDATRPHQCLGAAAVVVCLLALGGAPGAQAQLRADSQAASVRLGSIIAQQAALSEECRRLERSSIERLKQVRDFEQANGARLQLEQANTIRVPAICLLLNGPPGTASGRPNHARLDMVNWIFEADDNELGAQSAGNSSTSRRQRRQIDSATANELLSDYLFDTSVAQGESVHNELASNEDEQNFIEHYGKLLADERYKAALEPIGKRVASYLSPVVLVPGLAGSRLQARVTKQQRVNIVCSRDTGWQEVWMALRWFLPLAIDCWIDNARLVYDPESGFAHEPAGVETRVPDFGSVESVRHLDVRSPTLTKYFDAIIEHYLLLGYQADKNLFAAPYDFRLAPQQLEQDYFAALKQLIERAAASSGRKVTLVCHSMGCTNMLYFLRLQTSYWRQAVVRKLIAISSPWAGSTKALKALIVGDQFGLPLVSESKLRYLARTLPGVAYLLPQAEVFARPNKYQVDAGGPVLVQTPQRVYTVAQLEQLLDAAQLQLQWQWFKRSTEPLKPLEPLADLHVDCLHSLNIPTPETIIFTNQTDFPDGDYSLTYGDGDGTVNHQSLLVCADWAAKLPGLVRHKIIKNTSHTGMLSHKQILDHLTQDVTTANQNSTSRSLNELENDAELYMALKLSQGKLNLIP